MKRSQWKRKTPLKGQKSPLRAKKPKKPTITSLKKKLDGIFSQYIRQKYANEQGNCSCYTCGVKKHWKELQNGHFVSRSQLATRFDEDNVRPQCVGCNVFGDGKTALFATKLDEELGLGTVSRLYRQAQQITKDYPYIEKIEEYTKKLSTLNQ